MSQQRTISSTFGKNIKITVFGGSHEPEIGVILERLPKGFDPKDVDETSMLEFLARRAPGRTPYGTPRKEEDRPIRTSEQPLTYVIRNTDPRSSDYEEFRFHPRPGHADFTAAIKYGETVNMAGGGPFSGRMTAPLCIAGAIAKQILEAQEITVAALLTSAGGIATSLPWEGRAASDLAALHTMADTADQHKEDPMYQRILAARAEGDSVGGVVHCVASGVPAGTGGAMYDGIESYIAPIIYGIPGVKGLAFGEGFDAASMTGSTHNDAFVYTGPAAEEAEAIDLLQVVTATNHAGGILGGIANGMDITMNVAFKPTASIAKEQQTVDLRDGKPTPLSIKGRHDPCIAVRAVPVVEAAVALGLLDAMMIP